jgi:hypothetical protein
VAWRCAHLLVDERVGLEKGAALARSLDELLAVLLGEQLVERVLLAVREHLLQLEVHLRARHQRRARPDARQPAAARREAEAAYESGLVGMATGAEGGRAR